MDNLTKIVIFIVLLLLLIYYYKQYTNYILLKDNTSWPIDYKECPDYWVNKGNHVCENINKLGNCKNNLVDFKKVIGTNQTDKMLIDKDLKSESALNTKCNWAKYCNVSWEGVDKLCD